MTRPSEPRPSTSDPRPGRPPGRPRNTRADRAILEAAVQSFIDDGYEGMSMEGVAAAAGVAKTTIYRRWPCKEDLLLAAIDSLFEDLRVPDTGDVRADLVSVARQAHHFLTETNAGQLLPRMAVELSTRTPLGRAYLEKIMGPRLAAVHRVLDAAKERGELRPDVDGQSAVGAIMGSMMFLRISGALDGMPDDLPERLVGQLLDGIETAG
jgi:AcrR family transcriptional regulator